MDRTSQMNNEGAAVELIPRRIDEAKGNVKRGGGLNTKHKEKRRAKNKTTRKEEKIIRTTGAAKAAGSGGGKTRTNAPCVQPSG